MVKSIEIELFKDLTIVEYLGISYDLHNTYQCQSISLVNGSLIIKFENLDPNNTVELVFDEVEFNKLLFLPRLDSGEGIILDSFYRGRFEVEGKLQELSEYGHGYFYVDFLENVSLEFFAKGFKIEQVFVP